MLGIVAHDAGSAEIISSYVRQNGLAYAATLDGPAKRIFSRKLGPVESMPLDELVSISDWVLCGTSYPSDLEWRAIQLARKAGKRCVSVLDHWVNYRQRFVRNGEWHFPDTVWVGDALSAKIASETLPEVVSEFVPNAYFIDIQKELESLKVPERAEGDGLRILYACQPVAPPDKKSFNDRPQCGYTEKEALRYFLSHINCLGDEISQIVIRPHPREALDEHVWVIDEFNLPIVTGSDNTLIEQVSKSDIVAGCATMAMVVGLLANKRVVSCIPPGGQTVALPHPEIEKLDVLFESSCAGLSSL